MTLKLQEVKMFKATSKNKYADTFVLLSQCTLYGLPLH